MRTAFRTTLILTIALFLLGGVLLTLMNPGGSARAAGQANPWPQTDGIPFQEQPGEPAVKLFNLAMFGPQLCTSYGDPFSPFNSIYAPGSFAYRYEILIPPDYEVKTGTSIVRVELLDPDSMNGNQNTAVMTQTQPWLDLNPGEPVTRTVTCNSNRKNPCVIHTCEWDQADGDRDDASGICSGALATLTDTVPINPFWVLRIDENRGSGGGSGNGFCGQPGSYTVGYNTITLFELYYRQSDQQRTPLASYTGQSGNKTAGLLSTDLDAWDHGTDMRWVSPGAPNDFGDVPTDCGSPTGGYLDNNNPSRCPAGPDDTLPGSGRGFEIDLSVDTAGLQPDRLGYRSLFLDVTNIGGSSENGYGIWAGPPSAVSGLPSNINLRHVALANDRANDIVMDHGVQVLAVDALPINSAGTFRYSVPLQLITPYDAVREYRFSMFDSDSGTMPPLYFYHDQIDRSLFEVEVNPDSSDACFALGSSCNNRWFGENFVTGGGAEGGESPVFQLPAAAPDGRLMAEFQGGKADTYVILVDKRPLNMLLIPLAINDEVVTGTIDLAWDHPAETQTLGVFPFEIQAGD
ncbi:MAG: hypothetical protein QNJ45_21880 [Ardenticatenaceae bacterium]|nr:hypothetical protein [Ardenticatenaceae bacterium]